MTRGLTLTVLGSGSGGNCALLTCGRTKILVDAGFSGKQIVERLAKVGVRAEELAGILITHEHGDHVVGLPGLVRRYQIPVYCNRLTREALLKMITAKPEFRLFETGDELTLGDFTVESFPVPHDAYDPCGFVIHGAGRTVGFLTDLGYATHAVIERVRKADVLVLEANHDLELLKADTKRPWAVKQRILARHGHLSNEAAAALAVEIVTDRLKHLFLGHLSEDCNDPLRAEKAVQDALSREGVTHVTLHQTSQKVGNPPLAC